MGRQPTRVSAFYTGYRTRGMWLDRYQCEWAVVVGDRIRRLRREAGLTLSGMSRTFDKPEGGGYSAGYLSRLERGYANPPLYVYLAIAAAFDVEPGRLLGPDDALGEVSHAELTIVRALRDAGVAPHEALARLVSAMARGC